MLSNQRNNDIILAHAERLSLRDKDISRFKELIYEPVLKMTPPAVTSAFLVVCGFVSLSVRAEGKLFYNPAFFSLLGTSLVPILDGIEGFKSKIVIVMLFNYLNLCKVYMDYFSKTRFCHNPACQLFRDQAISFQRSF